jgi:hypothetical protein
MRGFNGLPILFVGSFAKPHVSNFEINNA